MPPIANVAPFIPFVVIVVGLVVLAIVMSRRQKKPLVVDRQQLLDLQNNWRAPSDLLSFPIPRPVRMTGQAKMLFGFMVLFQVGAGIFAVFGISAIQRDREREALLGREGVITQATIMRKWETRGKSTSYYAQYRYEVNGQVYHRQARIPSSAWRQLTPGSEVPARYAPSKPEISRLEVETRTPSWVMFLPFGVFALVIVLLPLPVLMQKKLLQSGSPAGAIVTRVTTVKNGKNVQYQFLDAGGNQVNGNAMVPASQTPEPGQAITVIYNPDNPKRNTIYPPQMVRLDVPAM